MGNKYSFEGFVVLFGKTTAFMKLETYATSVKAATRNFMAQAKRQMNLAMTAKIELRGYITDCDSRKKHLL